MKVIVNRQKSFLQQNLGQTTVGANINVDTVS